MSRSSGALYARSLACWLVGCAVGSLVHLHGLQAPGLSAFDQLSLFFFEVFFELAFAGVSRETLVSSREPSDPPPTCLRAAVAGCISNGKCALGVSRCSLNRLAKPAFRESAHTHTHTHINITHGKPTGFFAKLPPANHLRERAALRRIHQ